MNFCGRWKKAFDDMKAGFPEFIGGLILLFSTIILWGLFSGMFVGVK